MRITPQNGSSNDFDEPFFYDNDSKTQNMRIVGEIEHPRLKITVFKNEGKFSLKFENGLLEQTYKFRDDDRLASVEDVKKMVDTSFIEKIEDIQKRMYAAKMEMMQRHLHQPEEDEFEVIV